MPVAFFADGATSGATSRPRSRMASSSSLIADRLASLSRYLFAATMETDLSERGRHTHANTVSYGRRGVLFGRIGRVKRVFLETCFIVFRGL